MQSSQRVENTHGLVKRKDLSKRTPLKDLFGSIRERLHEDLTTRHIMLEDETKVDSRDSTVARYFPGVVEVNNEYLGRFAREATLEEMCESSKFLVNNIPADQAIGWHLVNPQTAASNPQLEDGDDILEFDIDSEDDEDGEDYVVSPEDNKTVNESTEYRQGTSRAALAVYLMDLGLASIEAVFEVVYEVPPKIAQYVTDLKEGACAHFFRAKRFDSRVQYHMQLIPTRWFRENKQDDPGLEAEISELPFTLSTTHGQGTEHRE
ncbi:hypothetical protein BGX26_003665 [Mortierella sp. AD094]|nr:hypothetical protein BGX26_003665 [Mortierella sp. AD094]